MKVSYVATNVFDSPVPFLSSRYLPAEWGHTGSNDDGARTATIAGFGARFHHKATGNRDLCITESMGMGGSNVTLALRTPTPQVRDLHTWRAWNKI